MKFKLSAIAVLLVSTVTNFCYTIKGPLNEPDSHQSECGTQDQGINVCQNVPPLEGMEVAEGDCWPDGLRALGHRSNSGLLWNRRSGYLPHENVAGWRRQWLQFESEPDSIRLCQLQTHPNDSNGMVILVSTRYGHFSIMLVLMVVAASRPSTLLFPSSRCLCSSSNW